MIDVDLVDIADEPIPESAPPCVRCQNIPDERPGVGQVELDGHYLLPLSTDTNRRLSRGAQVPDPLDLAERADDAAPATSLANRDRRRSEQAGLAPAHGHEDVWSHRHTDCQQWLAAEVHPKVVQERLGHSSVTMTLDLYLHAVPGMQADAASSIAALIDAV